MSIIFQTIFNLLRKRENEIKAADKKRSPSEAPTSRPPRAFYPASETEDDPEETESEEDPPSNE